MTTAPRTPTEFVDWLFARHPTLAPILETHLSDNDGELLSHVLFGDVTRYASDLARRADVDPTAEGELRQLLTDLDSAMLPPGEDDFVHNLVWVSFVENAHGVNGDPEESLRVRLRQHQNLGHALSHYE
jgi:hypothetical protein